MNVSTRVKGFDGELNQFSADDCFGMKSRPTRIVERCSHVRIFIPVPNPAPVGPTIAQPLSHH